MLALINRCCRCSYALEIGQLIRPYIVKNLLEPWSDQLRHAVNNSFLYDAKRIAGGNPLVLPLIARFINNVCELPPLIIRVLVIWINEDEIPTVRVNHSGNRILVDLGALYEADMECYTEWIHLIINLDNF